MNNIEIPEHEQFIHRTFGDDVETRVAEISAIERAENGAMVVEGTAIVFDQITDIGPFRERVQRDAFDDVLNDDVRFLVNHTGLPLARTTNGTLQLRKSDVGIHIRAELADTPTGRETYELIKRGDINQMSFSAQVTRDGWRPDADGVRVVSRVKAFKDVSVVTFPAYNTTSIVARSWAAEMAQNADTEPDRGDESSDQNLTENQSENNGETADVNRAENQSANVTKFDNKPLEQMNLNELKATREKYVAEHAELIRTAEQNGVELNEAQNQRADFLVMEVERLDNKIRHRANHEKMTAGVHVGSSMPNSERREIERMNRDWSLTRAIQQIVRNGHLDGIEAEWTSEARRDNDNRGLQTDGNIGIPSWAILRAGETDSFTSTTAGGDAGGGGFVPTNVPGVIEALRAPSVIEQTGVTVIPNAVGNLQFPRVKTKMTAHEKGEIAESAAAGGQLDEVTLSPERLTAWTSYSKQLAMQGGAAVDRLILGDLIGGLNAKMDTAAFSDIIAVVDGTTINIIGTDGADKTLDAALVYGMEGAVLADHANLAGALFVMSPKALTLSRSEAAVASVSALWENGRFANYNAIATPYLADDLLDDTTTVGGQMLFGNFAQAGILAKYGSPDILVDPYSNAKNGQILIHINQFWDFALRQPQALAFADQLK